MAAGPGRHPGHRHAPAPRRRGTGAVTGHRPAHPYRPGVRGGRPRPRRRAGVGPRVRLPVAAGDAGDGVAGDWLPPGGESGPCVTETASVFSGGARTAPCIPPIPGIPEVRRTAPRPLVARSPSRRGALFSGTRRRPLNAFRGRSAAKETTRLRVFSACGACGRSGSSVGENRGRFPFPPRPVPPGRGRVALSRGSAAPLPAGCGPRTAPARGGAVRAAGRPDRPVPPGSGWCGEGRRGDPLPAGQGRNGWWRRGSRHGRAGRQPVAAVRGGGGGRPCPGRRGRDARGRAFGLTGRGEFFRFAHRPCGAECRDGKGCTVHSANAPGVLPAGPVGARKPRHEDSDSVREGDEQVKPICLDKHPGYPPAINTVAVPRVYRCSAEKSDAGKRRVGGMGEKSALQSFDKPSHRFVKFPRRPIQDTAGRFHGAAARADVGESAIWSGPGPECPRTRTDCPARWAALSPRGLRVRAKRPRRSRPHRPTPRRAAVRTPCAYSSPRTNPPLLKRLSWVCAGTATGPRA